MESEHANNNGMSERFILSSFLSVMNIAAVIGMIAIENLKNNNVEASIPFCVSVLTNIPLEPNKNPARIGRTR